MNKMFALILLFSLNLCNGVTQEKFIIILDSLSVSGKVVATDIKKTSCNYFEKIENKENFFFKKMKVIYINSYSDFSFFYMFPSFTITNSSKPKWNGDVSVLLKPDEYFDTTVPTNQILLYDNKRNNCFLIKYSQNGSPYYNFDDIAASLVSIGLVTNIEKVYKLDKYLKPLTSISFLISPFLSTDDKPLKEGDIIIREMYFYYCDELKSKVISTWDGKNNINNITYNDLVKLLTIDKADFDKSFYETNDFSIDKVFFPDELFFDIHYSQ